MSGRGYQESLREVEARLDDISALKKVKPDMRFVDCVLEVCFESPGELRSRWGDIFPVRTT